LKDKNYTIDRNKKVIVKCNDNNTDCKEIPYKYHFNTFNNILMCNDKFKTNDILRRNNIPVPNSFLVPSNVISKNFVNLIIHYNISYPLVIKDNNGTFGLNVYTNINNLIDAMTTLKKLSKVRRRALIEEQIDGDCYRIFIFNYKIIDIIKREKPYIIGNGKSTVIKLIENRNKKLKDEKLYPTKNISNEYIKEQGYNIKSILEKDKKLYITNIINFHNGASISRVDIQNVPQKNLKLFIDVAYALDIKCIGIDYLSNDIKVEYDFNNGRVLEVNGTPDTSIHSSHNRDQDIVSQNFYKYIVDNI
jgi:glutathione synthase/RimK-type ligase-like ATP-grasp enzyme